LRVDVTQVQLLADAGMRSLSLSLSQNFFLSIAGTLHSGSGLSLSPCMAVVSAACPNSQTHARASARAAHANT